MVPVLDAEAWQSRAKALERALLARLALAVVVESIDSSASPVAFRGPEDGPSLDPRCPMCLEFVEAGEPRYIISVNRGRHYPFHDYCLEEYMESQVALHAGE